MRRTFFIFIRNHYEARFTLLLALIVAVGLSNKSYGQYTLSLGANYVYAFGEKTINFQNDTYRLNTTQGYELTANNTYHFQNTKLRGIFEVGFRQLYFSGESDNLIYSGQLYKLIGALGCGYSFSKKFSTSAYIDAENNLSLGDFNIGAGDLFRISLSLESTFNITERLGLTCLISRAMTPISPVYIIPNPQYQVRFGLTYTLIK